MNGHGMPSSETEFVGGNSPSMRRLLDDAHTIARTREPILLLGETGTGKERLARAIHVMSSRSSGPWVPVNCASLSPDLADSDLFGHTRGAFTGADSSREGYLKSANNGTILLDELGDLPVATQVKLLRVFEDPRIRAKGADKTTPIDVRFIAATSVDLAQAIRDGRFRRDLLERFQATYRIPPLRDRPEDVEPLARHFLSRHAGGEGLNPAAKDISADALALLRAARWPGNARELERAIKSALARTFTSRKEILDVGDFLLGDSLTIEPSEPQMAEAIEAVRALAVALLDGLQNGKVPVTTIENLAKWHSEVSLKRQLAEVFLSRYEGAKAHEQASRLFGYTGAESVRRLLRTMNQRDVERGVEASPVPITPREIK